MQQMEERVIYSIARQSWLDKTGQTAQGFVKQLFSGSETGRRVKDFLNGVWLAHPLHPAVTDVPIGAWTTSFALDTIETLTGTEMKGASSAAVGLGIAGAAASAATGIADWSDTVGDQRKIGSLHAITNTLALSFYLGSLRQRLAGHRTSGKLLGATGFLTVLMGAYLGGELAYKLGTQVNRNAWSHPTRKFTKVLRESELPPETPTRVEVKGLPVVLVRHENSIYAMSETCSHVGGPLAEGHLEGDCIVCPWHGSTFRLEDGSVVHGPSAYSQPVYDVQIQDGDIEIRLRD